MARAPALVATIFGAYQAGKEKSLDLNRGDLPEEGPIGKINERRGGKRESGRRRGVPGERALRGPYIEFAGFLGQNISFLLFSAYLQGEETRTMCPKASTKRRVQKKIRPVGIVRRET